jgi:predicted nucleic acid-binding protein
MKTEYIDQYGINSLPHVIAASQAKCSFFVTANMALIKDRKQLEEKYNLRIVTPKEFLALEKVAEVMK